MEWLIIIRTHLIIFCITIRIISRESLKNYYSTKFPHESILQWLLSGTLKRNLINREFSFTLPGDVYIRFISFSNPDAFLRRLQSDVPIKIDVGAVYSGPPSLKKENYEAVEREFVFDIDLTDYDDVRTCCK